MKALSHWSRRLQLISACSALIGLREVFERRLHARRVTEMLLSLDDRVLKDIGLSRTDLLAAYCQPDRLGSYLHAGG